MPFATYVARYGLAPNHVAGVTYTISFDLTRFDKRTEVLRRRPRALAGNAETLYFGKVVRYDVTLLPIQGIDSALIREFLESTLDGQAFLFDPYGTPDAQREPIQCDREDEGHTEQRVTITDDPVNLDHYEYSFSICVRT